MANLSASAFIDLVKKSSLVDDERLESAAAEFRSEHPTDSDDSQRLGDYLVERGLLTRWQCEKLALGKTKGFFLGKYKLLEHIGTGCMSSVYLAEHRLMHQRRAIKVLPKSRVNDSSYLARFRLEAQATARLDHRNIVRAYDIDEDNGQHYIVMEYVQGKDLQNMVKEQGPLAFDDACRYIIQSAEGLQHAHDIKLIHRDIKPANLLVDERGVVKLLDLGLALFSESEMASLTIAHNENVLGTADYLSPEQARNSHQIDHRADIYSLGCTLYYLLCGHPPFPDGSLAQRIARHQTEMPEDLRKERRDCPRDLADIVVKMMQKKPQNRYQTAREVAEVLSAWLVKHGYENELLVAPSQAAARATRARAAGDSGKGSGNLGGRAVATTTAPAPPPRREAPGGADDTVSDQARETFKGLDERAYVGPLLRKSDSGASLPRAKPMGSSVGKAPALRLPQAKPLDGKFSETKAPEKKPADRNGSSSGVDLDAGVSGPSPILKVDDEPLSSGVGRLTRSGKEQQQLLVVWIAVGAAALVAFLVLIIALMSNTPAESDTPQPAPSSGKRKSTAHVAPHAPATAARRQSIG
jgi:serine/threonine protein kinase